jgi:hypothetical protein
MSDSAKLALASIIFFATSCCFLVAVLLARSQLNRHRRHLLPWHSIELLDVISIGKLGVTFKARYLGLVVSLKVRKSGASFRIHRALGKTQHTSLSARLFGISVTEVLNRTSSSLQPGAPHHSSVGTLNATHSERLFRCSAPRLASSSFKRRRGWVFSRAAALPSTFRRGEDTEEVGLLRAVLRASSFPHLPRIRVLRHVLAGGALPRYGSGSGATPH